MFLNQLSTAGAKPALAAMFRFAGARQQSLAHNIANFDTPNFRPADADPRRFQAQLGEALDRRRARTGGAHGSLGIRASREVRQLASGDLEITPRTATGNVLFHDRNNRDLERMMQDMVENASMYRMVSDLMRRRSGQLGAAIGERVA
ncbi:MAG: hypothetical protein AAFR38_03105 [Planctomycetota bacterium]